MSEEVEKGQTKPKGGAFLLIMLALYGADCLFRLVTLVVPASGAAVAAGGPSWFYPFNLITFLVEAASLIAILLWRKWGIYTYAAWTVVTVIVDFSFFNPRPSLLIPIQTFILLGLLIWAVARKWKFFH